MSDKSEIEAIRVRLNAWKHWTSQGQPFYESDELKDALVLLSHLDEQAKRIEMLEASMMDLIYRAERRFTNDGEMLVLHRARQALAADKGK